MPRLCLFEHGRRVVGQWMATVCAYDTWCATRGVVHCPVHDVMLSARCEQYFPRAMHHTDASHRALFVGSTRCIAYCTIQLQRNASHRIASRACWFGLGLGLGSGSGLGLGMPAGCARHGAAGRHRNRGAAVRSRTPRGVRRGAAASAGSGWSRCNRSHAPPAARRTLARGR